MGHFDHEPSMEEVVEFLSAIPPREDFGDNQIVKYAQFVRPLKQYSKGSGNSWTLYMTVDGRIQQCRDVHVSQGKSYHEKVRILPPDEVPRLDKQGYLVVQVSIDSELHGCVTDFATGVLGPDAKFVDKTNPLENATTSARGRALAAFGYGIIPGAGIASAEEVEEAMRRREGTISRLRVSETRPEESNLEALWEETWNVVKMRRGEQAGPDDEETVRLMELWGRKQTDGVITELSEWPAELIIKFRAVVDKGDGDAE